MSMYEDVQQTIRSEINRDADNVILSPTFLARAAYISYSREHDIEPHLEYLSIEQLKQMARKILARNYDADGDESTSYQGDMFSGMLQDRYPLPREKDVAPQYKLLSRMTDEEIQWNVKQLLKSADARIEHAQALEAYSKNIAESKHGS